MGRLTFAAVVAAAAAAAHAGETKYGEFTVEAVERCTKPLGKCAGEANHEYVEYVKCCDESRYGCVRAPKLGWGKFCIPKGDDTYGAPAAAPAPAPAQEHESAPAPAPAAKCYANGIKCEGAPGYAYYPWAPCCDAASHCVEAAEKGWGKFCMPKSYAPASAPVPAPAPIHAPQPAPGPAPVLDAKCYDDNVRCMGAAGYAYYHYMPCCKVDSVCAENAALGWGKFCMPSTYKPDVIEYKPDMIENPAAPYKPDVLIYEPEEMPAGERCYESGERCAGAPGYAHVAWKKCCKSSEACVEDVHRGWGRFCIDLDAEHQEVAVDPPKIHGNTEPGPGPKCTKGGESCDDVSKMCCHGLECAAPWYGYGKVCVSRKAEPNPNPNPSPHPAPQCVPVGEGCDTASKLCCQGSDCEAPRAGVRKVCVAKKGVQSPSPKPAACVRDLVAECNASVDCCNKDFECRPEPLVGGGKYCLPRAHPKCVEVDDSCVLGVDVCCGDYVCGVPVDDYVPTVWRIIGPAVEPAPTGVTGTFTTKATTTTTTTTKPTTTTTKATATTALTKPTTATTTTSKPTLATTPTTAGSTATTKRTTTTKPATTKPTTATTTTRSTATKPSTRKSTATSAKPTTAAGSNKYRCILPKYVKTY